LLGFIVAAIQYYLLIWWTYCTVSVDSNEALAQLAVLGTQTGNFSASIMGNLKCIILGFICNKEKN
jgi:hypothetical protein